MSPAMLNVIGNGKLHHSCIDNMYPIYFYSNFKRRASVRSIYNTGKWGEIIDFLGDNYDYKIGLVSSIYCKRNVTTTPLNIAVFATLMSTLCSGKNRN
jgi:hypothetical protein